MNNENKETSRPSPRPGFVLDVDRNTPPIVFTTVRTFVWRNYLLEGHESSILLNR